MKRTITHFPAGVLVASALGLALPSAHAADPADPASTSSPAQAPATHAMRVAIDPQSGQLRAPTAAELREQFGVNARSSGKTSGKAKSAQQIRVHSGGMRSAVMGRDRLMYLRARTDKDLGLTYGHEREPAFAAKTEEK